MEASDIQDFMPCIIIGVIWMTFIIVLVSLFWLFPPEINYWTKVYDKCNITTGKYIYVIRFIFRSYKKSFDLTKTTVTIEITGGFDGKQTMSSFQIQSKQLVEHIPNFPNAPLKTVRFLLHRKEQLKDIKNVLVTHNGIGSIELTTIEIQDMNEKEANIAYVGNSVVSLPRDKAITSQLYPSAQREARSIEQELKPSVALNAKEFVIFVCFAINIMLIITVYVIPCTQSNFCTDYNEGLLSSVYSGLIAGSVAGVAMVVVCSFHRYIIRNALYKGYTCCSFFRYVILWSIIGISLALGVWAAYMASGNNRFPEVIPKNSKLNMDHEVFWMFAFSIAILVFFAFWVSILSIIARMIGFFSEPEEIKVDIRPDMVPIRPSGPETDKDNNDYMSQLIKGNTKVKSISQYGGLNQKKTVKRSDSTESTGSGYYKQLMKGQTKVKSVSQYKGVTKG